MKPEKGASSKKPNPHQEELVPLSGAELTPGVIWKVRYPEGKDPMGPVTQPELEDEGFAYSTIEKLLLKRGQKRLPTEYTIFQSLQLYLIRMIIPLVVMCGLSLLFLLVTLLMHHI